MPGFSNYLADQIIEDHLRGVADPWVTVSTTEIDDDAAGGGTVTAPIQAAFDAPVDGVTQNTSIETFVGVTGGTYNYGQVWDVEAKTNLLYSGALNTPKTVDTGDNLIFNAGEITVTNT